MHTARRLVLFCGVAVVNILTTLLPVWPMRYRLLTHGVPVQLIFAAQDVTLLAGVSMLLLAFAAAHGHHRAVQLLIGCTALAVVANLLKGLDVEEALLNAVMLVVLWRGRHAHSNFALRYTVVDVARLGLLLLGMTIAYRVLGRATLAALHMLVEDGEHTWPAAAAGEHLLTAKLALQIRWFRQSELLLPLFLLGVFLVFSWTSLIRPQGQDQSDEDLYQRFGRASHNSLAYLARRSDVHTFLEPNGRGAMTYRRVGRVALQIGALLAQPVDRYAVYAAFRDYCRAHRLIPAAVALSHEERPAALACGMRTLPIGTEAVVDLASFAVAHLGKKMRWAQRSLAKRGFTCEVLAAGNISAQLRVALDRIDDEWRQSRGGQLHGCCMTLGRFPTRTDHECLIGLARDDAGQPVAYLTLLPGGVGYYSLDLTRRLLDAPNAIMEYLLIETLCELRTRGASMVSLNFSTFSSLASRPAGKALVQLLGGAFQLDSLASFNAKFRPEWVPRYVALPTWTALPDVAYAVLHVEGVDRMIANALTRWLRRRVAPAFPAPRPLAGLARSTGR